MEAIGAFLKRDWGLVLTSITFAALAVSFVGAPRAISELVGVTSEAFESYDNRQPIGSLLLAVPAGLLAHSWRAAVPWLVTAIGLTFLLGLDLPSDSELRGLAIIGSALTLAMVAGLVRLATAQRALSAGWARTGAIVAALLGSLLAIGPPNLSSPAQSDDMTVVDMNVADDVDLLDNMFGPSAPPLSIPGPLTSPTINGTDGGPAAPVAEPTLTPLPSPEEIDRLYNAVQASGMPMYQGEPAEPDEAFDNQAATDPD